MTDADKAKLDAIRARLAEAKTPRQIAACGEWLYEQELAEAWKRAKEASK